MGIETWSLLERFGDLLEETIFVFQSKSTIFCTEFFFSAFWDFLVLMKTKRDWGIYKAGVWVTGKMACGKKRTKILNVKYFKIFGKINILNIEVGSEAYPKLRPREEFCVWW